MTNKRPLKSFIRYDGSGRAVSSSLIWRKNKPKVGNWKEVQGYECCNGDGGSPLSNTIICTTVDPSELGGQNYIITIQTFDESYFIFSSNTTPSTPITTYQQFVDFLNANLSFLGEFTYVAPNQICLQIRTGDLTNFALQNYPNPLNWNIIIDPFVP